MKKRTQVLAWIYFMFALLLSIGYFEALLSTALSRRHGSMPTSFWLALVGAVLFSGVQCFFWYSLIRKRTWGWNGLLVIYSLLAFAFLAEGVLGYVYHGMLLSPIKLVYSAIWFIFWVAIPLLALLTDRPSGWETPGAQLHLSLNDIASRCNGRESDKMSTNDRFSVSEIGFPKPPFR